MVIINVDKVAVHIRCKVSDYVIRLNANALEDMINVRSFLYSVKIRKCQESDKISIKF